VRVGRLFEKLGDECCLCLRLCLCICLCEDHGLVFRHVSSEISLEVSISVRFRTGYNTQVPETSVSREMLFSVISVYAYVNLTLCDSQTAKRAFCEMFCV
jgi:hypothetical protein